MSVEQGTPGRDVVPSATAPDPTPERRDAPWSDRVSAVFISSLGVVLLVGAFRIDGSSQQAVSPRVFPLVIASITTAIGCALLFREVVATWRERSDREPGSTAAQDPASGDQPDLRDHWPAALGLVALLVVYMLTMPTVGYWQANAIFFVVCSRILGSRQLVRDIVIALVLSVAVYALFEQLLGVDLPAGYVRFVF